MFEKKQSINQDFKNNYSRIIRINTQCTHQYSVEDLNQFFQDYRKLIQAFNLIQCAVQEQIKMIRKRFKKKRHNQFYTGLPHRATSSLLCTTCRESSTNSINCSHTINQPISTPRRNQYPAKLIHCSSPQPPINFSRNIRLTPIAQTCQFLLPVEIRTLQIDPLLPAAFNQFQQKPQANTYSPDQSISTPRRNQTLQIDLLLPADSNQFQQKTQAYF